jgi:protein-tyrosine-phosphatase
MRRLILTVCNGNIHRSVIAASIIAAALADKCLEDRYAVLSRGIAGTCNTPAPAGKHIRDYPTEWGHTKTALQEIGVDIPDNQRATPITRSDVERASVILAMDKLVLSEKDNSLHRQFPDGVAKMRLFTELAGKNEDVPDLFRSRDAELYKRVIHTLYDTVSQNFDTLLKLADNPS